MRAVVPALVAAAVLSLAGTADAAVTVTIDGVEMEVTSNGASDSIVVSCATATGKVRVNGAAVTGNPDCTDIRLINLYGGDGNDTLDVSSPTLEEYPLVGMPELFGEDGNDILVGPSAAYLTDGTGLYGGPGDDTITDGPGNSDILPGTGTDTVDGGSGTAIDSLSFPTTTGASVAGNTIGDGAGNSSTLTGIELLYSSGGAGAETFNFIQFTGDEGVRLFAGGGMDTIVGSPVGDDLRGEGGNDTIGGAGGADSVYGGDGVDNVYGEAGADYVSGTDIYDLTPLAEADKLYGGAGNDTVVLATHGAAGAVADGGADDDELRVDSPGPAMTLTGGADTDTLSTQGSATVSDTAYGASTMSGVEKLLASSVVNLNAQAFTGSTNLTAISTGGTIRGGTGTNVIKGSPQADTLTGGPGADTITGLGGADSLSAGTGGTDTLDGGDQDDTFAAANGAPTTILCGNGTDTVTRDLSDPVTACENVTPPVPGPPTPPDPPAPPTQPTTPTTPTVPTTPATPVTPGTPAATSGPAALVEPRLTVRKGVLKLFFTCRFKSDCRTRVTGRIGKKTLFKAKTIVVKGGTSKTISFKVSSAAVKTLRKAGARGARVTIVATQGTQKTTTSRKAYLAKK